MMEKSSCECYALLRGVSSAESPEMDGGLCFKAEGDGRIGPVSNWWLRQSEMDRRHAATVSGGGESKTATFCLKARECC